MDPNQDQNPPAGVSPLNQNPNPPAQPMQENYDASVNPIPVVPEFVPPEPRTPVANLSVGGQPAFEPVPNTVVPPVPPMPEPTPIFTPPTETVPVTSQNSAPESFQQYNSPFGQDQGSTAPPVMSFPPAPAVESKSGVGLKKIFALVVGLLVVVIGLFVAFKFLLPPTPQDKEVTLTYWGLWEPDNVMAPIIQEFEKDNPKIKISYKQDSPKEYRERLSSAFAQGKGPDIFRFHNTWVPMFAGDLAPIPTKIMDNGTFESIYYPVIRQDLRVGNSYVGIPLMIDGLGMYVNDDIFQTAGLNPPQTWDELKTTAPLLTTPVNRGKGNIQIAGVALGKTENIDHWSDILAIMMLQNNTNLANPSTCVKDQSLNKEYCYGADVLSYFTMFSNNFMVWDETLPTSTRYFAAGKLAIYFGPSWEAANIKAMNPQLKFRILPIPQVKNAKNIITWASYWVEGVWEKSPNKDAAWKFLKYLSEKETMQKLYKLEMDSDKNRLFGEPYSRMDMADLIKDSDYVGAFVRQASTAQSWYLASNTYDNGIDDKLVKYFGDAVNGVNSGKYEAKVSLSNIVPGISQILSQYRINTP